MSTPAARGMALLVAAAILAYAAILGYALIGPVQDLHVPIVAAAVGVIVLLATTAGLLLLLEGTRSKHRSRPRRPAARGGRRPSKPVMDRSA